MLALLSRVSIECGVSDVYLSIFFLSSFNHASGSWCATIILKCNSFLGPVCKSANEIENLGRTKKTTQQQKENIYPAEINK